MRHPCLRAMPALLFVLTGCISHEVVVKLKPDGSGTVVVTDTMSTEMVQQVKQMMAGMAKGMGGKAPQKETEIFKVEDARKKAAQMGEGVTFVKGEKIKTAQAEGLKSTYAFKDITKLSISQKPDKPNAPGASAPAKKKDNLAFTFSKQANGNALLTVVFPKNKAKSKTGDPSGKVETPKTPTKAPNPQQMAMMKKMFKGLKMSVAVEVQGKLVKTNSSYVDGNKVTLFAMDFGALLENEAKFKDFATQNPKTLEEAKTMLKGLKGFKVNLEDKVRIEFSGP